MEDAELLEAIREIVNEAVSDYDEGITDELFVIKNELTALKELVGEKVDSWDFDEQMDNLRSRIDSIKASIRGSVC